MRIEALSLFAGREGVLRRRHPSRLTAEFARLKS